MKTPVAFLVFNRPEVTRRVFERIAAAKPARLLIVGDGPRDTHPGDAERVRATRDVIAGVDWPCEVSTHYSDVNLGCRQRISTGLDWVFSLVEEAIILEDDCLPDPSFFVFCEELLERYRDVPRVMHIGGDNFLRRNPALSESYFFTRYSYIWGWATWRRAWLRNDAAMAGWDGSRKDDILRAALTTGEEREYWRRHFDLVKARVINTWDYAWLFSCWQADGVAVMPRVNLVTNIGFGAASTHTRDPNSRLAGLPAQKLDLPLRHPSGIEVSHRLSGVDYRQVFQASLTLRERWWQWRAAWRAAKLRPRGGPSQ